MNNEIKNIILLCKFTFEKKILALAAFDSSRIVLQDNKLKLTR